MKVLSLYSIILLCLIFTVPTQGQSLYQDVRELSKAFSELEQSKKMVSVRETPPIAERDSTNAADTLAVPKKNRFSLADTIAVRASAKILAILDHYRKWSGESASLDSVSIGNILETYRQDSPLSPLLNNTDLVLNKLDEVFSETFTSYQHTLQSGPRRQILEILNSDFALSPVEYLSVSRALKDYEYPPKPDFDFLQSAAEVSNPNVKKGFINEAEIIIGLFNFLLNRAQEEFVVTYLERLLGKNGVEQLGELFPNTTRSFDDKNVTYSESFLVRLRDAFYEDMQLLSLTLPELLKNEKYFNLLDEDPILFNFLHIYSMIGLAQQGVPISEIVPLTFRNLFDRYEDRKKSFNLKLVYHTDTFQEYQDLIPTTELILNGIDTIYGALGSRETQISENLEALFFSKKNTRYSLADLPVMRGDYQDLEIILNPRGGQNYSLQLLPSLLSGKLDASIVENWSTLDSYDRFLRNPLSETQMQAAGLELARRLNGAWYQELSIVELLRQWQQDVFDYQDSLLVWEAKIDSAGFVGKEQSAFSLAKNKLNLIILKAAKEWESKCSEEDKQAFLVLRNIINDTYLPGAPSLDPMDNVRRGWVEVRAVEERLAELNEKLIRQSGETNNPGALTISNYFKALKAADAFHSLAEKINRLEKNLSLLQTQLNALDARFAQETDSFNIKYAQLELNAIKDISPLVQVTEVLSHLMYVLRSDDLKDPWINRQELDSLFFSESFRPAFMGLLSQQLGQAKAAGGFSIENLSALARLTVRDLDLLSSSSVSGQPDSLGVFRKAVFASNAINRLLELPLFTDPANPDAALSLIDKNPRLAPIPALSEQTVDFIYFLNVKDHRHALSSFIRLFNDLTTLAIRQAKNRPMVPADSIKREKAIKFLNQYGDFIADLVDAESSRQVEDLLEGFADPPGSSRVKRREPVTFNLNGYVGGLIGEEKLEGNALTNGETTYTTLAPTIPVGLSFSKLLGKGANPQSFSLFFSLIDLGSLTTYALDPNVGGDNQLTFKNILRPGLQLHWNIKKSPFFLGVGGQQGPVYREFNGKQEQLNAFRLFFNFGIDVVIKRFH